MSRLDAMNGLGARYPSGPGHVFGSATSRAGAEKIRSVSESLEMMVLSMLRVAGARGLTDFELQAAAEREGVTSVMRARRAELYKRGEVMASGMKRPSPISGIPVTVWVLR